MNSLKTSTFCLILLLSLLAFACDSSKSTTTTEPTAAPTVKTVASPPPLAPGEEIAVLETVYGKIRLRLFPDVAPKHVASFKKYISEGFYNGLAFHRVIPGVVIQAGNPATKSDDKSTWPQGERSGLPTIPAEFSTLPFVRGTLGAARTSDPNSASTQFFICLNRNEQWDREYTVFGQVIEGMNVADIIANSPTDPGTEIPTSKATITRAYLEKYAPK
ncbi:MAG: peptidylprolyl isomerase [Blastocatellia bacterium]